MARPSIVDDTPDLKRRRKKFFAELKAGVSLNTAAAVAGLGRSSVFRALQRARKEKSGAYHQFGLDTYAAMEAARAKIEKSLYRAAGAKGGGKIALAILRSRYPKEWNPEVMVRMMRIEAGLDPDSGKPLPTVRVIREVLAAAPALPAPASEGAA